MEKTILNVGNGGLEYILIQMVHRVLCDVRDPKVLVLPHVADGTLQLPDE